MSNSAQTEPDGNKPEGACQILSAAGLPVVRLTPPKTDFEDRVVRISLHIVMGMSIMMWSCLLPVWWYEVMCLVPRMAWHQVHAVYHHGEPVNMVRLERVLLFWPRGFFALFEIR